MASAISLHTIGNMEAAVITSVTSAAAGYPKENLLNMNPDIYWKPTSTANQAIVVDLVTARQVDRLVLWVHNYTTNHVTGSSSIKVSYSSDNATYTQWSNHLFASYFVTGVPLIFAIGTLTPQTYRYWKIEFLNMSTTIEISQIFLARKYTLGPNQYPERDVVIYHNRSSKGPGGRKFVSGINKNPVRVFPRTFTFVSTAAMQPLIDAHANSRGSLLPLAMLETYGIGSAMVRFADDELNQNKVGHQIWMPSVEFEEIPHIYPGETM